MAFVMQVAPRYALASYGFDNRYHFPHQKAMNTYAQQNIPVYNTEECGMMRLDLQVGEVIKPICFRSTAFNCYANIKRIQTLANQMLSRVMLITVKSYQKHFLSVAPV